MEGDRRCHGIALRSDEDSGLGHAGHPDPDRSGTLGPPVFGDELRKDAANHRYEFVGIHLGLSPRPHPGSGLGGLGEDPAGQIDGQGLDPGCPSVDADDQLARHYSS